MAKIMAHAHQPAFIAKVWAKWADRELAPVVPAVWPTIKAGFAEIAARPYVRSILLTGSVIAADNPSPKDIDVAVLVNDPAAYAREIAANPFLMPREIDGMKIDPFPWTRFDPFFPAVDPERRLLHLPRFGKFATPPSGGQLLPVQFSTYEWTAEQMAELKAIATAAGAPTTPRMERPAAPEPEKPCGCSRRAKRLG